MFLVTTMYIRYLQCIMCKAGDSYAAVMARVLYLKHSSCMLTIKTFLLWFKSDTFVWSVSVELRRLLLMLYFALTYQWRLKLGLCVWIRHGPGLRLVVPPPPMLQQRHYNYYVYALRVPASVPRHRYFFRFARILNGFRWNLPEVVTSHYREQIKHLHFGRNWSRDKGAEYGRIFESTSIGVAAISYSC